MSSGRRHSQTPTHEHQLWISKGYNCGANANIRAMNIRPKEATYEWKKVMLCRPPTHLFRPKTVEMNQRNSLASNASTHAWMTPIPRTTRATQPAYAFNQGCLTKRYSRSDWMVVTVTCHYQCSEDLDQLQHGCLQHRAERTLLDLLTDPFLINVIEEDLVLWQLRKIQEMHQLVRNHRMETNSTIVRHGESQSRVCVSLRHSVPMDSPGKVWLVGR